MDDAAFCNAAYLVQLGRNYSLSRPESNIQFTKAYFSIGIMLNIFCLAAWLMLHSRYERTRVRPTSLVCFAVLSSLSQMLFGPLQIIVANDYPCGMMVIFLVMIAPFATASVIGRLALFSFLSQFALSASNTRKANLNVVEESHDSASLMMLPSSASFSCKHLFKTLQTVFFPSPRDLNAMDLHTLKRILSGSGTLIMCITVILPYFIMSVGYVLGSENQRIYLQCMNCALPMDVVVMMLGSVLVLVSVLATSWCVLAVRFPALVDIWGLKTECLVSLCALGISILGFALSFFDSSDLHPYSHQFMVSFGLWLLVMEQSVVQLVLGWKQHKKSAKLWGSNSKTDAALLERVMHDSNLYALFEAFLVHEFAAESLYFLSDVKQWSNTYYDVAENTRRGRARRIYQNYILPTGLYTINIPATVVERIKDEMNMLENTSEYKGKQVNPELFAEAQREISNLLLSGALMRFVHTAEYKVATLHSGGGGSSFAAILPSDLGSSSPKI